MKGIWFLGALACVAELTLAAPARADRATVNRHTGLYEIPLSDLRKAAERGDRAELARAAGRLGPARLGKALGESDHRLVLAALEAVPLLASGVLLLDQVTALFAARDESVRARAVRAAAALLSANGPDHLSEWEVAGETIRNACQRLTTVAGDEREATATRLAALQGLADAGPTCAGSLKPALLLGSAQGEVRRAAVLALSAGPDATSALLAAARDGDGRVAAAAGARLCQRRAKLPATQPPLRDLARAAGAEPEDVMDLLPCLASSTDAADRKALDELREHGPSAVRDAAKAIVERRLQAQPEAPPPARR